MEKKQILLNALTTLVQVVGTAGALFFLYRFLIRTIGIERLGIWSLVLATTSVVTLANQGFSTSIVKFVAKYVAKQQAEDVSALVQTALLSIGIGLAVISIGLYPAARWILRIVLPHAYLAEAAAILPYALASLWINLLAGIVQAGLAGHELITHRNYVVLGSSVGYLVLAWLFVPPFGLLGLAYSQTIVAAGGFLIAWVLLRRCIPLLPFIPRRWSLALFREMANYGLQFQLITISQAVREPATKALLAKFGGLAMTGFYDMAMRWVITFRELIVQANQVLVPTVASLQERDPKSVPVIYRESYRLIFFLAVPTFAFLTAMAPVVSRIWLGHYEPLFVRFVGLLAVGWLVNILSNPAYVVDVGTGKLKWVSIGCGVTAILNISIGFVAGKYLGGDAVVVSSVGCLILGYAIVLASYHLTNRVPFAALWPNKSAGILASSLVAALIFLPLFRASARFRLFPFPIAASLALIALLFVPMWIHPMRKRLMDWVLSRSPA